MGLFLMPPGKQGNYAVLVCGDTVPDREICGRLEGQGITGLVSESGQTVLLDCFEGVEEIPLDEYGTRLLPFDPRNDGYADKLRSLFVRDGKRFIYIRLGAVMPPGFEKKISAAFGDYPYSLEFTGTGRPAGAFFIIFAVAAVALFAIRPLRRIPRSDAGRLILCLPPLVSLAPGGAAGLALASLLSGFAVLAADLRQDAYSRRRGFRSKTAGQFMVSRLLPPVLIAAYWFIVFFSEFPVILAASVFALFCLVLVFSLRGVITRNSFSAVLRDPPFSRKGYGHFSPVPIIGGRAAGFTFSWAMLPFSAAALLLALAGRFMPAPSSADLSFLPPGGTVAASDFAGHFLFQSTFSLRPLHADGPPYAGNGAFGMPGYKLAEDGLPDSIPPDDISVQALLAAVPPFPLEDLTQELNAAASHSSKKSGAGNGPAKNEIISALIPALLALLFLRKETPVRSFSRGKAFRQLYQNGGG